VHAACLYSNIQGQVQLGGSVGFVCMQPWLSMSNDDDVFDDDDDDEDDNGVK